MDINLGQTVYVNDDIATVTKIAYRGYTVTEVIVQWSNRSYQAFNPNECIPLTPRQSFAYIILAELSYLFARRAVTEIEQGIRVDIESHGETHSYIIDRDGEIMARGTVTEAMARLHQYALEIQAPTR